MVTGGLPILIVVAEFIKYFNFTVSRSPDGLRLRFGLAKTETRTVPPGRVQAIEYIEPLLWRRWGWVRLRVNIAGIGGADSNGRNDETLLIPVATREVLRNAFADFIPATSALERELKILAAVQECASREVLPEAALQHGQDGTYVYVVRDGRAVVQPVRATHSLDGQLVIEGEVRAGEAVLVEIPKRLKAGGKVTLEEKS